MLVDVTDELYMGNKSESVCTTNMLIIVVIAATVVGRTAVVWTLRAIHPRAADEAGALAIDARATFR